MNPVRTNSSPDFPFPQSTYQYDDSALEGVAANVKLLLKLIQDHKNACNKEEKDSRRMLRVAGMMTILDTVRTRIQKCQSFGNKRSEPPCNTDLINPNHAPSDHNKRPSEAIADENERLRKQLNASLAARKSLEVMCSSLGKEKEIMAAELSRKNYELSGLEEHINDLGAQNESLLERVKEFAAAAAQHDHKSASSGVRRENAQLQERYKVLSEQLLSSLDGYRYMKRKLREAQELNHGMLETMEEITQKIGDGLQLISRGLKEEKGESEMENVLECLEIMVSKHCQRKEFA